MTQINIDDFRTPEGGFVKDAPFWTIAYRNPRANRFLRIDLALTWHEARDLAGKLAAARPDLQVFYTTTAAAEVTDFGTADDVANILVDSGRRVRVLEGGTLPADMTATVVSEPVTVTVDPDTRVAASAVQRDGRRSARFHEFRTLAERNGYHSFPGGYIKNMSTGGTAAHGWVQFAERVLSGSVPLVSKTSLDRGEYASARLAAPAAVLAHTYADVAQECAGRGEYERATAWLREAADETDRQDEADARDAYAHAGYGVPVTTAELAAGYADWDAGRYSLAEQTDAYATGRARRRTLERLAALADAGRTPPPAALDSYARGEFDRATAWMREDVMADLRTAEIVAHAELADRNWTAVQADRAHRERMIELGRRTAAADAEREARRDADTVGWDLTPLGRAALKSVTGFVTVDARPLCLRADGAHVGHMAAVDDECRAEVHQDPYDAAAEAVGRHDAAGYRWDRSAVAAAVEIVAARVPRGYAVGGPMNADGTYATWGLPN